MPIPPLEDSGYLPPGDHDATLDEVERAFGSLGFRRRELMGNLRDIVEELWGYGVDLVWVDGSFVSAKKRPGDADVIYARPQQGDPSTWGRLSPSERRRLADIYGIHLWEHPSVARHGGPRAPQVTIKQFFETDMDGVQKGHLVIRRPQ